MQPDWRANVPLTFTSLNLEAYEHYANLVDCPTTFAPDSKTPSQPAAANPAVAPDSDGLALKPAVKRLDNWRLVPLSGPAEGMQPHQILGAVVQTADGHTSPITTFDPLTRRVRTRSGSTYKLGVPLMAFERIAPEVMRCLGF